MMRVNTTMKKKKQLSWNVATDAIKRCLKNLGQNGWIRVSSCCWFNSKTAHLKPYMHRISNRKGCHSLTELTYLLVLAYYCCFAHKPTKQPEKLRFLDICWKLGYSCGKAAGWLAVLKLYERTTKNFSCCNLERRWLAASDRHNLLRHCVAKTFSWTAYDKGACHVSSITQPCMPFISHDKTYQVSTQELQPWASQEQSTVNMSFFATVSNKTAQRKKSITRSAMSRVTKTPATPCSKNSNEFYSELFPELLHAPIILTHERVGEHLTGCLSHPVLPCSQLPLDGQDWRATLRRSPHLC